MSDAYTEQKHSQPSALASFAMVLILDQDCASRRELEYEFRALGAQTCAVEDPEAARRWALQNSPDLVLIEPGPVSRPALILLAELRTALPRCCLVITTSYGSVATAVQAVKLGADQYLCKPVKARLIIESLGEVAGGETGFEPQAAMTLDQAIWEYLHLNLELAGSIAAAARRLGIWRQSFRRMLSKYRPASSAPVLAGSGAHRTARRKATAS